MAPPDILRGSVLTCQRAFSAWWRVRRHALLPSRQKFLGVSARVFGNSARVFGTSAAAKLYHVRFFLHVGRFNVKLAQLPFPRFS